MLQLQALALVIVEVFGRTLPVYQQAVLLQVVLLSIMVLNAWLAPISTPYRLLSVMELLSLGTLTLTVALSMFFLDADSAVGSGSPKEVSVWGTAGVH